MFEIVYDDGRTTDGRRLDGYTISSPCEPNGSGELKRDTLVHIAMSLIHILKYTDIKSLDCVIRHVFLKKK